MKIIRYNAKLSSGKSITENTEIGSELSWDSLHWSNEQNLVADNQVQFEQTEQGKILNVHLGMELLPFTETMCFVERNPIEIEIEAKADSTIVAYYYFKDWWTRPAFVDSFSQVPDESSILFFKEQETYHFLLALPGKTFRSHFEGKEGCNNIRLVLSADSSSYTSCNEKAMLALSDINPYQCIKKGMEMAANLYHIPTRSQRTYPSLFEKIGWCSWNAFYKDVNEEGLLEKAKEIRDKKIPFGWLLIDDGWQSYRNDRMIQYECDTNKFPNELKGAIEQIQSICGIDQIGVWHAFNGYWCGIDFEGPLAKQHPEYFLTSNQGKLLPKPEYAYEFFKDWYKYLSSQGITFVKVDSQSSTRQHYRGNTPIGQTSAALHAGLDKATSEYFNEGLINCMGMAMEDVLQRPVSGISRNSDDFFPLEEESFKEHLLENAYNTLWHNVLYYGDWDMFWSTHIYAQKHALLRALSAGPIYVSDRVGDTVLDVLKPLCYEDGTILRADIACVPTMDCLLKNPETSYLKLVNIFNQTGYLAIYSYIEQEQIVTLNLSNIINASSVFNDEVFPLKNTSYAIWDVFNKTGTTEKEWTCHLDKNGCNFYQAAPIINGIAVFGRSDKYLSSHSILERTDTEKGCQILLRESGPVCIYAKNTPVCTLNGKPVSVKEITQGFYEIECPIEAKQVELIIHQI